MQNNKKKIFTVAGALFLAAVLFFAWRSFHGGNTQSAAKHFQVTLGSIQKLITATGTVQPQNRIEMKAPVGGRIDKVLVEEGQDVKAGDVLAVMSSTERTAILDSSRLQGDKEAGSWEDVYKQISIISPIDGQVIVKGSEPGQTVTTTDPIVVLSDRLIVQAQVDETDVGRVKEGQKALISLDAYPEIQVDAAVQHIYYESTLVNNVTIYKVDIVPEKIPNVFRSGMSANVRIVEQSKDGVLLIPQEAVKRGKDGSFVFVSAGKGRKPAKTEVRLGVSDDANIEALSGVKEGDDLVVMAKKNAAPKKAPSAGGNPFMPSGPKRKT